MSSGSESESKRLVAVIFESSSIVTSLVYKLLGLILELRFTAIARHCPLSHRRCVTKPSRPSPMYVISISKTMQILTR